METFKDEKIPLKYGLMDKKWRVLKRKRVFDSKFVKIYEDIVKLPNGTVLNDYTLIKKSDVVLIVPTDKKNKVITIKEYRHGAGQFQIALPAGLIESNEPLIKAAKRELLEETGFSGGHFKYVGVLNDYPSKDMHKIYVVRAKNVKLIQKQKLEMSETITSVRAVSRRDLKKQIANKKWKNSAALASLILSRIIF
ncbi:MAG: NUDIX hydrolase [Candidatus Micrarchaeota archaeon]|nr:NUDIX hydrolase [Candidatus Micrarchaeota archaeon]